MLVLCVLTVVKGGCADFGSGGWERGLGDVGLGSASARVCVG